MSILKRIYGIIDAVNTCVPVPFAGKPYRASWKPNEALTDVLIIVEIENVTAPYECPLSELEIWDNSAAIDTVLSELYDLTHPLN